MVIYIALFALAILLAVPLVMKNPTPLKKAVYVGVMFTLMYIVTIFRYGIGNDYYSYIRIFKEISAADFGSIFTLGYEPLYALIAKLVSLVTDNYEVMYGIFGVLILAPVGWSIYRHSDNVWQSVVVYLCFTFFYTSLNFIRQSLAVSVIILAYGFMKKRKIIPVLIFALAAALLHYTALIFIPLYLISLIKPTKKYLIIFGSVSIGILITCLIMKAVGANPLNLAAQAVTAVTGKDYTGYISSKWFEVGFGVEYLIMPLGVLAVVLISYFCGWKEKKEADLLLQLTLFNASIWSFITYAFIVERFSMFIFIFSVFTIPSVLTYFKDKAENTAKKETVNKTMPGYSKRKSEDKKDSAFLLTVGVTIGMFVYNCWGMAMNFHGVFPYSCGIPAIQDAIDGNDSNTEAMYMESDIYKYMIELKSADCGYVMVSTIQSGDFAVMTPAILRGAEYLGEDFSVFGDEKRNEDGTIIFNDRNNEKVKEFGSYESGSGYKVTNDGEAAVVTDPFGRTATVNNNKIGFVLFNENGIFDGMEFYVTEIIQKAGKLSITKPTVNS